MLAALKVSFGLSLAAAAIDAVFGLIAAWVLTRYRFPGRKLLDYEQFNQIRCNLR